MMTYDEFKKLTSADTKAPELAKPLQALLADARGDWDQAHRIAQSISSWEGAWVHAYLHRKEGDSSNAAYWYSRAGKPKSETSLDDEWEELARKLLES
jgi:hypothetical protein